MSMENKAVFFDRDGTLNVDIHYLHRPEDFIWIPGAKEAIRHVNDRGYLAILVTNQSGVARGYYPESDVRRVYDWMNCELQKVGAHLDALYYCPHHPDGSVPRYTKTCACRKPSPGLLLEITRRYGLPAQKLIMAGDSRRDLEAVAAVGGLPILVRTGNGAKAEAAGGLPPNTLIFDDLAAVSAYLLAREADKGQAPQ